MEIKIVEVYINGKLKYIPNVLSYLLIYESRQSVLLSSEAMIGLYFVPIKTCIQENNISQERVVTTVQIVPSLISKSNYD